MTTDMGRKSQCIVRSTIPWLGAPDCISMERVPYSLSKQAAGVPFVSLFLSVNLT